MLNEQSASHDRAGAAGSFFFTVFVSLLVSAASLWVYHTQILRPWEVVSVDFRRLSDAKLGQLTERALAGQPTSMGELERFVQELQRTIRTAAHGRPVFISGAVLHTGRDLTAEIADVLNIDLTKGLEASLPGMANRVGGTLSRNMDGALPGQSGSQPGPQSDPHPRQ